MLAVSESWRKQISPAWLKVAHRRKEEKSSEQAIDETDSGTVRVLDVVKMLVFVNFKVTRVFRSEFR